MAQLYRAYGLTIASHFALPELVRLKDSAVDRADIVIVPAPVDGPMPEGDTLRIADFAESDLYFAWRDLGRIRVRDLRYVDVDLVGDVHASVVAMVLLGPVIAAILHRCGALILHGSSVRTADGQALVFLGDNGAGKSSLAGACVRAGMLLLNDDVVMIEPGETPRIRAGFPAMKLSGPVLELMAPLPGTLLPAASSDAAKRRLRLADQEEGAFPIAHTVLLRRGDALAVGALPPTDAFAMLMRNSYMAKFGAEPLSGVRGNAHFMACAAMANAVPACELTVPASLEQMMAVPAAFADLGLIRAA